MQQLENRIATELGRMAIQTMSLEIALAAAHARIAELEAELAPHRPQPEPQA